MATQSSEQKVDTSQNLRPVTTGAQKFGGKIASWGAKRAGAAIAKTAAFSAIKGAAVNAFSGIAGLATGGLGSVAVKAGAFIADKIGAKNIAKGVGGAIAGLGAGIGGLMQGAFALVGMVAALSVTVPAAILGILMGAIVILGILVPIIMFIINSGAYITPLAPGLGTSESISTSETTNPYIGVKKTPNPRGPFENTDIPLTVEYTIEITAKLNTLTNITIDYECKTIKEGSSPDCPNPNPAIPAPPSQITTGSPFIFTYEATYDSQFQDSLVTDKIIVNAQPEGHSTQRVTGSASIIIGDPPTGCFEFSGGWPDDKLSMLIEVILNYFMPASAFMEKLCAGGNINLVYSPEPAVYENPDGSFEYGGYTAYPNITIYRKGHENVNNLSFTLAHESGHALSYASPGLLASYRANGPVQEERTLLGRNGVICTYPLEYASEETKKTESFAEMVALYISRSPATTTRNNACLGGTFRDKYPLHWNFARNTIFEDDLGW